MNRFAKQGQTTTPLLMLVAAAAIFVVLSSRTLPTIVASHFDASGQANGFMPRAIYVGLMLVIVALGPLLLAVLPMRTFRNPSARINLPHREYWLAPERRASTIDELSRQAVRFSMMLMAFLCYVHWLVVQANQALLPSLSLPWFVGGLLVFLGATLAWIVALMRRFLKVPG